MVTAGNAAVIAMTRPAIPNRARGEALCGSLLRCRGSAVLAKPLYDSPLWAVCSHMRCAVTKSPREFGPPTLTAFGMTPAGGGVTTGSTVHLRPTVRNPKHYCRD
jgi:hypothetical protein